MPFDSSAYARRTENHDFHATVLQLLGMNHERFTFKYQGLDQSLTGVEVAEVVKGLIA